MDPLLSSRLGFGDCTCGFSKFTTRDWYAKSPRQSTAPKRSHRRHACCRGRSSQSMSARPQRAGRPDGPPTRRVLPPTGKARPGTAGVSERMAQPSGGACCFGDVSLPSAIGMSNLTVPKRTAHYDRGNVTVHIAGTVEIRFPIKASHRLTKGTEAQLKNIEVSPLGLHWPELDEDLSFKGLLKGEF